MKDKKKYLYMLVFFIIIMYLTLSSIYDKKSFDLVLEGIKNIKPIYIIICTLLICLYFLFQGIYMKSILRSLNHKISLKSGIFYSLLEFYFSGITPSSTGGQPVQLYYMTKDNIPIRKSYITLMLNTIFFKLVLLILGVIVLIFSRDYILGSSRFYIIFFILGFVIDLIMVIFGFLLIFHKNYVKKILKGILNLCNKTRFLSKFTKKYDLDESFNKYQEDLKFFNKNKKTIFLNFIITFIQRLFLFSIIYVIYRALGFNKLSYFELLMIQITVQIASECVPLPGGTALQENMLHTIFINLFGVAFADMGMFLTRSFAFYLPLLASGIIIFIYGFIRNKKEIKKETE